MLKMHLMVRHSQIVIDSALQALCPGATICAERTALVKAVVGNFLVHFMHFVHGTMQSEGTRKFIALAITRCVPVKLLISVAELEMKVM